MYTLYYSPGTSSVAPQIVLEELGVPYHLERVHFVEGRVADKKFLEVNPAGKVPVLAFDGNLVSESAAICMLLADRHPDSGLAPAPSDVQRGRYYQWMSFLTNTMQVHFMHFYFADRYTADEDGVEAVKTKASHDLTAAWRLVEKQLATTPYVLGAKPSTCDLFLYMLVTWLEEPLDSEAFPHVVRWAEQMRERPAIVRTLTQNEAG